MLPAARDTGTEGRGEVFAAKAFIGIIYLAAFHEGEVRGARHERESTPPSSGSSVSTGRERGVSRILLWRRLRGRVDTFQRANITLEGEAAPALGRLF